MKMQTPISHSDEFSESCPELSKEAHTKHFLFPFHTHKNLHSVINHFTPNWFAVTMGTGVIPLILHNWSFHSPFLTNMEKIIWIYNIILFSLFSLTLILRCLFYKDSLARTLSHPQLAMFFGCIPMGLITIVNGLMLIEYQLHPDALYVALSLWSVSALLSLACIFVVPLFMFTKHSLSIQEMNSTWLLPFVACEVVAASGGFLIPHLPPQLGLILLLGCFFMWSLSVILASIILTVFFLRLCLYKLPSPTLAATLFLPLGPTGTGALGLFLLGNSAHNFIFAFTPSINSFLSLLPGMCLMTGLVLWAFSTWWLVIASLLTISYLKQQPLRFNMSFWAYTFPLGVYCLATFMLGKLSGLDGFTYYADGVSLILCFLWLAISMRTLHGAYHGYLINDVSLEK